MRYTLLLFVSCTVDQQNHAVIEVETEDSSAADASLCEHDCATPLVDDPSAGIVVGVAEPSQSQSAPVTPRERPI
jgi:hypothetical protein